MYNVAFQYQFRLQAFPFFIEKSLKVMGHEIEFKYFDKSR